MKLSRNRGVALIITLIMLSIITVMAVAFLSLSRRERASVVHSANSLDAELMASTALDRAKAEILANIVGTNTLGPELMVSRFRYSFPPFTNSTDTSLIVDQFREPVPPVFVKTNRPNNPAAPPDFRFFVDLNRNGRFEPTGLDIIVTNENGLSIPVGNGLLRASLIGDPVWLGILSNPSTNHSKFNRFVGRYAYLVLPVGKSLDLNWIHNQAKGLNMAAFFNGFFRNQGVGPWEINLAAFLADLNTNVWNQYQYNTNIFASSPGVAFADARELLSFRYQGDHRNLDAATSLFPLSATFAMDGIDFYSDGPLNWLGSRLPVALDDPTRPWPGANNRKNFFSVHDLFDVRKNPNYTNFVQRLALASAPANYSSYDSYTFYRMLGQLGTDSEAETNNKININFRSIDTNGILTSWQVTTNLENWRSEEFFTNAALKLFREEFKTNTLPDIYAYTHQFWIPVASNSVNGDAVRLYSSRVHRILQLTANIYDATTGSKINEGQPFYPTVFRPRFHRNNGVLFISSFAQEQDPFFVSKVLSGVIPVREMTDPDIGPDDLVYGVPLIIGARKGFPNFNEFAVQTVANFTRKLEVRKEALNGRPTETNHMFVIGISNVMALEAWNSYNNPFPPVSNPPRKTSLIFTNILTTLLTNDAGLSISNRVYMGMNTGITFTAKEVRTAGIHSTVVLSNSVYRYGPPPAFDPISYTNVFDRTKAIYTNQWGMMIRNKLLYFLVDEGHLVDAVCVDDFNADFDISAQLNNPEGDNEHLWDNTPSGSVTVGMENQIQISLGQGSYGSVDWNSYSYNPASGNDKEKAVNGFRMFLGLSPRSTTSNSVPYTNLTMQAPFTPTRPVMNTCDWEVNDPLVHYISDDLRVRALTRNGAIILTNFNKPEPVFVTTRPTISTRNTTIGRVNERYNPWGQVPGKQRSNFDFHLNDPGVAQSDDWDFPTNKFPTIGWLGRVHRGTPWQTIYLKAYTNVAPDFRSDDPWMMVPDKKEDGGPGLVMDCHPTNDWKLIDVFTTGLHPNVTRGRLSINQTNLAAWSAVLCGAAVTSLHDGFPQGDTVRTNRFIDPAAIDPAVEIIFAGISRERDRMPRGRFEQLGDILRVPELTLQSPYLNAPYISVRAEGDKAFVAKDLDYERIPDQLLSLLKVGEPRFVIYAFGQALKPETIDPGTGLAVNYQITGEVFTRTVLNVDFDPPLTNATVTNQLQPRIVVKGFNILPPE